MINYAHLERKKMKIKLPDYEGGFVYKSIEGSRVVVRNSAGSLIEEKPINALSKSLATEYGVVEEIQPDTVLLKSQSGNLKKVDRFLLNECVLISRLPDIMRKSVPGKAEVVVSGDYLSKGIGRITTTRHPEITAKIITLPDTVEQVGTGYLLNKSIGNQIHSLQVDRVGNGLVAGILYSEAKPLLVKAFGSTLLKRNPLKTAMPKQQPGAERPGHKYIERKPDPKNPGKYIYLYELPSGKRQWKNDEGSEIDNPPEYSLNQFKKNDTIEYNKKTGKIVDESENYYAVKQSNGQSFVINKKEHLKKVTSAKSYKTGMIVDVEGHGNSKILHLADNVALIHSFSDDKFKVISLEREITKLPDSAARSYETGNLNADDYQGNYRDDDRFKAYQEAADELGFGYGELQRQKTVKAGNELHTMRWTYDPERAETRYFFDGMENRTLNYNGKDFPIRNIDDIGYTVEDEDGEFKRIRFNQLEKNEDVEVTQGLGNDEMVRDKTETKRYSFKPEYTQEELDRFRKKRSPSGRRWVQDKPIQSEEEKKKMESEQKGVAAKIAERNKKALSSNEYKTGQKELLDNGYIEQPNAFILKKQDKVEGRNIEVTNEFNPETNKWEKKATGDQNTVEVDGKEYQIEDVKEVDGLFGSYKAIVYDNGKEISVDDLREMNGAGLFQKLKGKASIGKSAKIYLPNGEIRNAEYAIVDLDDILASHNEVNFEPTKGFPVDKEGNTVNDRDYRRDKNAQGNVDEIARKYDARNVSDSEKADGAITISKDFVVLSGNNRTMSAKLAADKYPEQWNKYLDGLKSKAESLGFNQSELSKYKKPFFVRIDKDFSGDYNKEEFAKYNLTEGKEKTQEQQSATYSEVLKNNPAAKQGLATIAESAESLSDLFGSESKVNQLKNLLVSSGIVLQKDVPKYFDVQGDSVQITGSGKDLYRQLVLGTVFDEKTLYEAKKEGVRAFSDNIIQSVSPIMKNQSLNADYTMKSAINEAVNLEAQFSGVKDKFKTFDNYISQQGLFGDRPSKEAIALNLLAKKGKSYFSTVLNKYNQTAETEQEGGMFGQLSKDEIFNETILNGKNPFTDGDLFTKEEKQLIDSVEKSFAGRLILFGKRVIKNTKQSNHKNGGTNDLSTNH